MNFRINNKLAYSKKISLIRYIQSNSTIPYILGTKVFENNSSVLDYPIGYRSGMFSEELFSEQLLNLKYEI